MCRVGHQNVFINIWWPTELPTLKTTAIYYSFPERNEKDTIGGKNLLHMLIWGLKAFKWAKSLNITRFKIQFELGF